MPNADIWSGALFAAPEMNAHAAKRALRFLTGISFPLAHDFLPLRSVEVQPAQHLICMFAERRRRLGDARAALVKNKSRIEDCDISFGRKTRYAQRYFQVALLKMRQGCGFSDDADHSTGYSRSPHLPLPCRRVLLPKNLAQRDFERRCIGAPQIRSSVPRICQPFVSAE